MTMALQMTPRITLRINWGVQESRGSTVPRLFLQVEASKVCSHVYVPQLRVTPAQKGISLSAIYFYPKISLDKIQLIVQKDMMSCFDVICFLKKICWGSFHTIFSFQSEMLNNPDGCSSSNGARIDSQPWAILQVKSLCTALPGNPKSPGKLFRIPAE